MPDQQIPDEGTVGEQWSSNFQQCLDLLRGPGDERRFVGLLLVTRLLPQGSDDAVRRVLEALGMQFIHRLLLPLRRPSQGHEAQSSQGEAHQQQQQQAATGCGLALAILAAACRLPEVAAGPDVRCLLPILLRVVRHGGLSTILQSASTGAKAANPGVAAAEAAARASGTLALSAADAAAVSDSLECLVAAAAATPLTATGALDAVEVLEALACWLTTAAAVLTTTSASGSGTSRPAAAAAAPAAAAARPAVAQVEAEAQAHNGTLLAASLLERLLSGGHGRPTALLAENPAAAARIMATLAAFIGNPRLLQPPSPSAAMQPAHTDASGGGAVGRGAGGSSTGGGGAAQLQLEALHLLLLLMRACLEFGGASAAAALVQLDAHMSWSAAIRRGVGWLLRSRVPGPLKQAALQLAACVVDLAGEGWLLGRAAGGASGSAVTVTPTAAGGGGGGGGWLADDRERPEAFLQLLAETLKIEIGLLLQDALHPERRVRGGESHRSSTLGHHAPPQPSQRLLDELAARAAQRKAAEEAAVAAAAAAASASGSGPAGGSGSGAGGSGGGPHQQQPLLAPGCAAVEGAGGGAMQATGGGEGRDGLSMTAAAAAAAGGAGAVGGAEGTMSAGARALALLPACFRLQEACVEAVAADAAAADGAFMDVDVVAEGVLAGAAAAGGPVLSEAAMQRLMSSFDNTIDTLLQFFEAAAEQRQQPQLPARAAPATASGGGEPPPAERVSPEVLLGAARVLGRYLAEAPGALRSERVLRMMPLVVAVRTGTAGGDGARAATGGAGTAGGEMDVKVAVERERGAEEDEEFALAFLLPGLLQATGPGADGRSETIKSLRTSSTVLHACVLFLGHCVRRTAAAVPTLERQLSRAPVAGPGAAGGSAAHAEVLRAERGLADVSMLLLNLLEPAALARQAPAAPASKGPAGGDQGNAVKPPESWAALICSPADAPGILGCDGDAIATAAATTSTTATAARVQAQVEAAAAAAMWHLPPLLAQLVPACWLVSRWAASRGEALQALHSLDLLHSPGCAAAHHLARWQISPRTLLCAACLSAVTLAATMRCLADAAVHKAGASSQAPAVAPTPAAPAPSPASGPSTAQTMDSAQQQARDMGAEARAVLPPAIVERTCAAALAAAAAGASLELQQLRLAQRQDAAGTPSLDSGPGGSSNNSGENRDGSDDHQGSDKEVPGEGGGVDVEMEEGEVRPASAQGVQWLTAADVLADYPGDGDMALERLLGACAQLVEMSGEMRRLALGTQWLRRLVGVSNTEAAARALLLDVNLALLLQVIAANLYSG